jgi:serine/threonine protein kinase/tetratricopeptide (TPR) repeat protein
MAGTRTTSGTNAGQPETASALAGRVIGDFRILRLIGKGGMGVVYEAEQISLERRVALKVLSHTGVLPEAAIVRFQREAQAAAKLHHPHIIPIFAQGQQEGVYYYAMKLVDGCTVHQVIAELRLTAGPASQGTPFGTDQSSTDAQETILLDQTPGTGRRTALGDSKRSLADYDAIARHVAHVADALDYAHQHGVIHRDVKPHNLMIDRDTQVSISDFGLARVLEQPGVTVSGEFMGSPLYMSPEQIARGNMQVDHRTDIYSLGATLYEWLTLAPPYPGDSREQVIAQILTHDPVPPRTRDPNIPVALETICLKALEKEPTRRYQFAAEMRDDLFRYLERSAIRARRAGPLQRFKKAVLRRPTVSMAVLAAAIVVSLTALFWQSSKSREAAHQAVREVQTARLQEAEQTIASLEEQREAIFKNLAPWLYGAARELIPGQEPEASKPESLSFVARDFSQASLAAFLAAERARLQESRPQFESGSAMEAYVGALSAFATDNPGMAVNLLDRSLELDPTASQTRHLRAIAYCLIEKFEEMESVAETLVAQSNTAAAGHLLRGAARLFTNRPLAALGDLESARRAGADVAWADTLAGTAQWLMDDTSAAMALFSQALEARPDQVPALLGRARCLQAVRMTDAALADVSRAIEIEPENAAAYVLRGQCYDRLGQYDKSIADYTTAGSLEQEMSLALVGRILAAQQADQQRAVAESRAAAEAAAEQPPQPEAAPEAAETKDQDGDWFERFLEEHRQGLQTSTLQSTRPLDLLARIWP